MERNQRLINRVMVAVWFVDGPEQELKMTSIEKTDALADIQDGLNMLSDLEPAANVSWVMSDQQALLNQPIFPDAPWKGLPRDFYINPLHAAVWRPSKDKSYLFQGDQYVRLTRANADNGYPRSIDSGWKGMPSEFNDGIDAAFWHIDREKFYLFRGDEYVRMTDGDAGIEMDAGYPRAISTWPGMPAGFASGIDAVVMHPHTKKIYMFRGDQYIRLTDITVDGDYPRSIAANWQLPDEFASGVQAALWRGDNDRLYLFSKLDRNDLNRYVRLSPDTFPGIEADYPKFVGGLDEHETEALWRDALLSELGLPAGTDGVKAMLDQEMDLFNTESGVIAFVTRYPTYWSAYARGGKIVMRWGDVGAFGTVFAHETGHRFHAPDEYTDSGCNCTSVSGGFTRARNGNCEPCAEGVSVRPGDPKNLPGGWENLAAPFTTGIDAALSSADPKKSYLFRGSQYVRLTGVTVDPGYPRAISSAWNGLPAAFNNGIDAACFRTSNQRTYMFNGSQYVRLAGTTMEANYPRSIASSWHGLPVSFHNNLDAVVERRSNGKIYLFKGSQYVRMTDSGSSIDMDEGYPASIASVWGLPSSGIDAMLWYEDGDAMYAFKDNTYSKIVKGHPCLMRSNVDTVCDYTRTHLGWDGFLDKIDAAVYRGDNQRTYLFSGPWYLRYTQIGTIDADYPKRIADIWNGLPTNFHRDLDAALWRDSDNKTFFFKGSEYVRLTGNTVDDTYPRPIAGNWDVPAGFTSDLDAALYRGLTGQIYLFKGTEYVRLTDMSLDANYPRPISSGFSGIPGGGDGPIDAAMTRLDTNQIYLFYKRAYLRYSSLADGPDDGYPNWIHNNWMPFPRD